MPVAEQGHIVGGFRAGGLAGEGQHQQAQVAGFVDHQGLGRQREGGIGHQGLLQFLNGFLHLGVTHIPGYDDFGGAEEAGGGNLAKGELFLHQEESLLGFGLVGEGVDVVKAGADVQVEPGQNQHRYADDEEADDRLPGYGLGDEVPEAAGGGVGALEGEAGQEGDSQEIDPVAQQGQHGRQQGQGGGQGNQHDRMAPRARDW